MGGLVHVEILLPMGIEIIAIDFVINSVCVLFMKTYYDKYYRKMCFYPEKFVNACCLRAYNRHIQQMRNMNEMVGAQSPRSERGQSDVSDITKTSPPSRWRSKSSEPSTTNNKSSQMQSKSSSPEIICEPSIKEQ